MEKCQYCLIDNIENIEMPMISCMASNDDNTIKITTIHYKCRNNHIWTKTISLVKDHKKIEYNPPIENRRYVGFRTANNNSEFTNPLAYRRLQNSARSVLFGSVRSSMDPVYNSEVDNGVAIRDPRYLGSLRTTGSFRYRHTTDPSPSPEFIDNHEIDMDDIAN